MDALTHKPPEIMITQEYKTTVGAVADRLERGKINRVEISLCGFNVKVKTVSVMCGLDACNGSQTVHVREYRHNAQRKNRDERRNVVIHEDLLQDPDGRL